jgi:hypothetical protein
MKLIFYEEIQYEFKDYYGRYSRTSTTATASFLARIALSFLSVTNLLTSRLFIITFSMLDLFIVIDDHKSTNSITNLSPLPLLL